MLEASRLGYLLELNKGKQPPACKPLEGCGLEQQFNKGDYVKMSAALGVLVGRRPFSGLLMGGGLIGDKGGSEGERRVTEALFNLALESMEPVEQRTSVRPGEAEPASRRGLVSRPFSTQFVRHSDSTSVWVISPTVSFGDDQDIATFPSEEDIMGLKRIHLLILLTDQQGNNMVGSDGQNSEAEIYQEVVLLDRLLDDWLGVPELVVGECDRCIGADGSSEEQPDTGAGAQNVVQNVRRLREFGNAEGSGGGGFRELKQALDGVYDRGRKLETLQNRLDYQIELVEGLVEIKNQSVPVNKADDWNTSLNQPFTSFRDRLADAVLALDKLAGQATNHARFRTMHETGGTKKIAGIVGATVFFLGVVGLYIESVQAGQGAGGSGGVLESADFAASFTILSVVVVAGYGALLVGLFQTRITRFRRAISILGVVTLAAGCIGLGGLFLSLDLIGLDTKNEWAISTAACVLAAGIVGALLWNPERQELDPALPGEEALRSLKERHQQGRSGWTQIVRLFGK